MREHVLLFCLLGLVLTATIILVIAPGAVTWALALIDWVAPPGEGWSSRRVGPPSMGPENPCRDRSRSRARPPESPFLSSACGFALGRGALGHVHGCQVLALPWPNGTLFWEVGPVGSGV